MIIVVEGASAAGKTTWVRQHAAPHLVPESSPDAAAPDRNTAPEEWVRYWQEQNERRWRRAVELEQETGLAVCDTDPLKAHYVWCLWQAGLADRVGWDLQCEMTIAAFEERRIGFADLVLFANLDEAELRARRSADASRQRRRFETHVRLVAPLKRWYEAVDRLATGRVAWRLPDEGLSSELRAVGRRGERSGSALFARFLKELERTEPAAETSAGP